MGESELNYVANTETRRFGDFTATAYGETVIPVLMKPRQLSVEIGRSARALGRIDPIDDVEPHDRLDATVATRFAELDEAWARRHEIQLTLRAPDGSVVDTEYVEITDLQWLLSLISEEDFEHFDEDWRVDLELAEAEFLEEFETTWEPGDALHNAATPWMDSQADGFDEFDVPDLEFLDGDAEKSSSPPLRYQIQIAIRSC